MIGTTLIANALCLPSEDLDALAQGRIISILPWNFISVEQSFALFPDDSVSPENVRARFWARCELCKTIESSEAVETISKLTIWSKDLLQSKLEERGFFFLAILRVYEMTQPVEVISTVKGNFSPLKEPAILSHPLPVLSDRLFAQRKQQLAELRPPDHPELEELYRAISQVTIHDPKARQLEQELKVFLGWTDASNIKQSDPALAWIRTIHALGTATTGGNYEKGTAFEQVVHKSLAFLGFELDSDVKGGSGRLDLYCKKPYSLVGECKSGKGIPGNTVYELDKLEDVHFDDNISSDVKLIIGPGKPTSQLQSIAQKRDIGIINPMTLQKLVELQANYPNSVNLIELKDYLLPGQIDCKIEEYIAKVLKSIQVRSHIVETVKQLTKTNQIHLGVVEIRTHYNAKFSESDSSDLSDDLVHELLIELSSPLAGYLGRLRGSSVNSDRFYFLRDLPAPNLLTHL